MHVSIIIIYVLFLILMDIKMLPYKKNIVLRIKLCALLHIIISTCGVL